MSYACAIRETLLHAAVCGVKEGFCASAQETRSALCARRGAVRRILPAYAGECAGIGAPYTVGCGSYQGARIGAPCRPWPIKRPYCGVDTLTTGTRTLAPLPDSAMRDSARAVVRALSSALAESIGAAEDRPKIAPSRLRRLKRREKARRLSGDAASQREAAYNRAESARCAFAQAQDAVGVAVAVETMRAGVPTCAPKPITADSAARLAAVDAAESAILRIRAAKRSAWVDAGGWEGAPLADLAICARTQWVRDLARAMYAQVEAARLIADGVYRAPIVVTDDTRETHWRDVSWQSTAEIRPDLPDTRLSGSLDPMAKPWDRDRRLAQDARDTETAFAHNYGARPDAETVAREVAARAAEDARETARIADARAKARAMRALPRAPECAGRTFASVPATQRARTRVVSGAAKDGRPATAVI